MAVPLVRLSAVTLDCRDVARVGAFWSGLLDLPLRVPQPGWLRLGPLPDGGPLLTFQPVPEPAPRSAAHLDLLADDLEAVVDAVRALGGSERERHVHDEGTVVVLADPEGHPFCVVTYAPGCAPA